MPPLIEKARAYVAKMPPAISGSKGHPATFAVARRLVKYFGLSADDAMTILREYNQRCVPPWTERELQYKINSAIKTGRPYRNMKRITVPLPDPPRFLGRIKLPPDYS